MKHVLVVDDEARIREVVEYALRREGLQVTLAAVAQQALDLAAEHAFDLVVLDVMLPEIDGLEVCRQLRRRGPVPVLFLSARGEEVDRIVGLELGGDDYLPKPFSPRELVARVRAVLRRYEDAARAASASHAPRGDTTSDAQATCGSRPRTAPRSEVPNPHPPSPSKDPGPDVDIDLERRRVRCRGELIELTPSEFSVLVALWERPGVVLTRAQLMQRADADGQVTERAIDTHVRRLRKKFRQLGVDPIGTVHGVGYRASEG